MKNSILAFAAFFVLGAMPACAESANSNAVSAPNGKVTINGGWDAATGNTGRFDYGASGAFAVPLGDRFGFQGDLAANQFAGAMGYSAAGHLFTRDPNAYLLGLVGGGVWSGSTSNYVVGPEAEAYLGPLTIGGAGGFVSSNVSGAVSSNFFASGDVKYYPMPSLKLELGAASFAGAKTAHAGLEWQVMDNQPITVSATGTVGDNNLVAANMGLTFYFGGTSSTLIDRHRHEDPVNFSTLLVYYNGAYQILNVATPQTYNAPGAGGVCNAGYALTPAGGCVKVL